MAYSINAKDHFKTKLYTGTGSSLAITGVGFQPDMVWQKVRSTTSSHRITDAIRGTGQVIYPNDTAQQSAENAVTAFGTDGFTVGTEGGVNTNSATYVSWNWKAGGGQGSSNTDGTINTTYTSANTSSGFSMIQYTGNATAGATIGHGLGVAPKMFITKKTNTSDDWVVYHASLGATKYLKFNTTMAAGTATDAWNDTAPTSSVISLGNAATTNGSGATFMGYAFADKVGFSKFGSYTGNGNADGPFVYTGFKPKFIVTKKTNQAGYDWYMWDTARTPDNPLDKVLYVNANNADTDFSSYPHDFLGNGFKIRTNNGAFNGGNDTYVYMAFAEAPLVGTNNIPATAR